MHAKGGAMSAAGTRFGLYELAALFDAEGMEGTRVAAWSMDGRLRTR